MDDDQFEGWPNADVVSFIDAYKACPELWNQSDPNYNNKPLRIESWGRIAEQFDLTKVECKKKIFELISTYRKLRMTTKQAKANGETSEPSWFAYRALTFLDGREVKQETTLQEDCPISEREVIIDILMLYRQNRCLWDNTHPLYVDKKAKHAAFSILLEELQKIDPMANIDTMKRRMENWKNAYRRQKSKVDQLKQNGKEAQPTLWYYKYLTFLDDKNELAQENEATDVDSNDMFLADTNFVTREKYLSDQEQTQFEQQNENQLPEAQQQFVVVNETRKRRRKTKEPSDDTQLTASALQLFGSMKKRLRNEHKRNEINAFCKFISSKIFSYSSSTRQGVQHALYDILMEADRGRYERKAGVSVRMNRSPNLPTQRITFAQSLQNITKSHTHSSSIPALEPVISKEEAGEYEYLQNSSHESMSESSDC